MAQFITLTSRVVVVPQNDIDTDQIIPARFLKTTDKHGLGASLFADWRYGEGGAPRPEFPLNQPRAQGACSREEPQPKLSPATSTWAPAAPGWLRTKSAFGVPSAR